VLDAIIADYVEHDVAPHDIVAKGFDPQDVAKVVRLIRINEYKRRQSPIGVRVSHRGFGKDWRYPVTNRFFGGT
jgi:NAD+ synthase (glutamine-hydrolysing)